MRSGELNKVITIEVPTETRDANGAVVLTWARFSDAHAKLMPQSGREFYAARQINSEVTSVFRIRWGLALTSKMRVVFGGQYHDILYLKEVENRAGMDILARVQQATD